jgi:hypothetical protein
MALPGIKTHRKFLRLVDTLNMRPPEVLGYLEWFWHSCHDHGNAEFKDETDVELAAGWAAEKRGKLAEAMLACGFLEKQSDGTLIVHDYFNHCPRYARRRADYRLDQSTPKPCVQCGTPCPSARAMFCGDTCRKRAERARGKNESNADSESSRECPPDVTDSHVTVTDSHGLSRQYQTRPDQTRPDQINPPLPPLGGSGAPDRLPRKRGTRKPPEGDPDGFAEFWKVYPKKRNRPGAVKAWNTLKPDATLQATMLAALQKHKQSNDWFKENGQYIPYPASWLNGRQWEDVLEVVPVTVGETNDDIKAKSAETHAEQERWGRESVPKGTSLRGLSRPDQSKASSNGEILLDSTSGAMPAGISTDSEELI